MNSAHVYPGPSPKRAMSCRHVGALCREMDERYYALDNDDLLSGQALDAPDNIARGSCKSKQDSYIHVLSWTEPR